MTELCYIDFREMSCRVIAREMAKIGCTYFKEPILLEHIAEACGNLKSCNCSLWIEDKL